MPAAAANSSPFPPEAEPVTFEREPEQYRHWTLSCRGAVATLILHVDEEGGLRSGYALKLNSYDLGVDIELHDALQRIRFEHPEIRTVVLTSGRERVFCSGANIFMLGQSSHAWKVNFCKFTNETRNGMEDASHYSGLRFLAACNGTTAGGGYELALACDEIVLVDDRSSAVSLPEVPLLGVLPGTGGLTRLTDKRRVRRDRADQFCTTSEGVRGQRAVEWKLVDATVKPAQFDAHVEERANALAIGSTRPHGATAADGIALTPLARQVMPDGYRYSQVSVHLDPAAHKATFTISGPGRAQPDSLAAILAAGADWWPLQMARELDDAILTLRTNHLDIGIWVLKTEGRIDRMLALDAQLDTHAGNWFVHETIGMLRRTLARLDVSSRSLFALIEPESCFAGTLLELVLAADRSYMLHLPDAPDDAPRIAASAANFGRYPGINGRSRLDSRFYGEAATVDAVREHAGIALDAVMASSLELVTATPDDIDWDDEIRVALEERASLSPDALTGMEANLRFGPGETMETRVFGRLSAWQNWIFTRPNATGANGALKVFGTGEKARFDRERV